MGCNNRSRSCAPAVQVYFLLNSTWTVALNAWGSIHVVTYSVLKERFMLLSEQWVTTSDHGYQSKPGTHVLDREMKSGLGEQGFD